MKYYFNTFAQAYGTGAYSANCYNNTQTACGTSDSAAGLSNTGIMVAGVVTIAAIILLVAIVVRVWRRPRRDIALQEQASTDNDDYQDDQNRQQ